MPARDQDALDAAELRAHLGDREAIELLLGPHRARSVRAFLARPPSEGAELALWALVFGTDCIVDHGTAQAVADQLEAADVTIGEVLAGWRPPALIPPKE